MYKASSTTMTSNHVSKHICPYQEDGCNFTSFDDQEMDEHMITADISHRIMAAMKKQLIQTCQIFESHVETVMDKLVSLGSEVTRLQNYIEWEITSGQSRLTEELQEVNRKQESLEGKVSKLHRQMSWDIAEELKKISRNQESLDESLDDALQNRSNERHPSSSKGTSLEDELKDISKSQEIIECDLSHLKHSVEKDVCEGLKAISSRQVTMSNSLDEIQHKQEVLSVGLERLQEDHKSTINKLTELEKRVTSCSQGHAQQLVSKIDNSIADMRDVEATGYLTRADMNRLEKLEATICQLEGKVSLVTDLTVQSGTHLWKVNKFSKLLEIGRSKEEFYIYSPEFFSDNRGYKMCLFMCPNGHLNGKDTHVSLYLQILKGPYDDDLEWPFKHAVSMETLDMSGAGKHKQYVFEPRLQEPEVECWMKPSKDRKNIGYGNHTFLGHTLLEGETQYLGEDTLYVRINVG